MGLSCLIIPGGLTALFPSPFSDLLAGEAGCERVVVIGGYVDSSTSSVIRASNINQFKFYKS